MRGDSVRVQVPPATRQPLGSQSPEGCSRSWPPASSRRLDRLLDPAACGSPLFGVPCGSISRTAPPHRRRPALDAARHAYRPPFRWITTPAHEGSCRSGCSQDRQRRGKVPVCSKQNVKEEGNPVDPRVRVTQATLTEARRTPFKVDGPGRPAVPAPLHPALPQTAGSVWGRGRWPLRLVQRSARAAVLTPVSCAGPRAMPRDA